MLLARIAHRLHFRRDHRWMPKHSPAYLDGELDDSGRARAHRHWTDCPECQALMDGLRKVVAALASIGTEPNEPDAATVFASLQGQLAELPADGA